MIMDGVRVVLYFPTNGPPSLGTLSTSLPYIVVRRTVRPSGVGVAQ